MTPSQSIRLGLLALVSLFLAWFTILRKTSPLCVTKYIDQSTGEYNNLVEYVSPVKYREKGGGFYQISDDDIYVYSAFYDNRYRSKYIRIFGMQNRLSPATVRCKLQLENGLTVLLPIEMSYPVFDQWPSTQLLYHAYYYGCSVPSVYNITDRVTLSLLTEGSEIEAAVPMVISKRRARYPASHQTPPSRGSRGIVICVKAMWGKVNATRLIEWLEFHRLLKVKKIVIYDTTIWGRARRVLEHYQRTGFVDVITFDYALRMAVLMRDDPFLDQLADERLILEQTYLVSMNDCYYRYKDTADYVAVIDNDEIIVPSTETTLSRLLLEAEALRMNASAFLFQTAWHLDDFGVGNQMAPPYLHTQRYTKRSPVMKSQPKAMVSVDGAIVINWHGSVTMPTGYGFQGNQYLPWKRHGYVHHYREHCKYAEAKCEVLAQMVELDEIIPRYERAISASVLKISNQLNMSHFLH
ncbi:hypothetical protein LSH36_3g27012 [Paralvinella palmiformis]|uniref:Glycosyltransferase family 92 protein n=1 Tax=Paralvinella palmiformis TaxID=53620 RepID=A0AAD9KH33_9ANNE|nr:hypothetical protein LSH36_3g27012 [Paralvinella palmiformis]